MGKLNGPVLVLGGTSGIGYEFASYFAKRGYELSVVSRGKSARHEVTKHALLGLGASNVEVISCDLMNKDERLRVLKKLAADNNFKHIFLGGPGPLPGEIEMLTDQDILNSYNACIELPIHWHKIFRKHLLPHSAIWILSSSAAIEPPSEHPFHLSSVLRRGTQGIVEEWRSEGLNVNVLAPKVVSTPMAIEYGKKLSNSSNAQLAIQALKTFFNVDRIESPETYIEREIEKHVAPA